jgi:hypothetical protein
MRTGTTTTRDKEGIERASVKTIEMKVDGSVVDMEGNGVSAFVNEPPSR